MVPGVIGEVVMDDARHVKTTQISRAAVDNAPPFLRSRIKGLFKETISNRVLTGQICIMGIFAYPRRMVYFKNSSRVQMTQNCKINKTFYFSVLD
jgi:hypothetical protein